MTNVPVALIFFSRPENLRKTFEAIRNAKPKQLFLIQDGPRDDCFSDTEKIKECREIVSSVDWDCEIYKNYSEVNLGCGERVSSGVSWAFEHVDRLAIIEDDCVPGPGFFVFCEELLERYKNDSRVNMISGMNNLGVYEGAPDDYFFAEEGSIWGWATWKRVWDDIDFNLDVLDDPYVVKLLANRRGKDFVKRCLKFRERLYKGEKMSSWSLQRAVNMYLNNGLIVVPKYNMIHNVGLGVGGANSGSSLRTVPRALRSIYFMETYAIKTPLKHPRYISRDLFFESEIKKIMGKKSKAQALCRRCESFFYRIIFNEISFSRLFKKYFLRSNG